MEIEERAALNVYGGLPKGATPCIYCLGRGKRLHDSKRDPKGMKPAGPYRCSDCNGRGYNGKD